MGIDGKTIISEAFKKYPYLKDEIAKIDSRAKLLDTPFGKMLIKNLTVSEGAKRLNIPENDLIKQINQIIEKHEKK